MASWKGLLVVCCRKIAISPATPSTSESRATSDVIRLHTKELNPSENPVMAGSPIVGKHKSLIGWFSVLVPSASRVRSQYISLTNKDVACRGVFSCFAQSLVL